MSGLPNRVGQRLPGEKRLEIGDHAILHPGMGFQGVTADMRGQHYIRKAGQRIRRMWLGRIDVEAGTCDGPGFEGRDQGRLIDDGTACNVDDVAVLAELLQDFGIDGVVGRWVFMPFAFAVDFMSLQPCPTWLSISPPLLADSIPQIYAPCQACQESLAVEIHVSFAVPRGAKML